MAYETREIRENIFERKQARKAIRVLFLRFFRVFGVFRRLSGYPKGSNNTDVKYVLHRFVSSSPPPHSPTAWHAQ